MGSDKRPPQKARRPAGRPAPSAPGATRGRGLGTGAPPPPLPGPADDGAQSEADGSGAASKPGKGQGKPVKPGSGSPARTSRKRGVPITNQETAASQEPERPRRDTAPDPGDDLLPERAVDGLAALEASLGPTESEAVIVAAGGEGAAAFGPGAVTDFTGFDDDDADFILAESSEIEVISSAPPPVPKTEIRPSPYVTDDGEDDASLADALHGDPALVQDEDAGTREEKRGAAGVVVEPESFDDEDDDAIATHIQEDKTQVVEPRKSKTRIVEPLAGTLADEPLITADRGGRPPDAARPLWSRKNPEALGAPEEADVMEPRAESADDRLRDLQAELRHVTDPGRAAALYSEIGRIYEEEKEGQEQEAEHAYLEAFERHPALHSNLRQAQSFFRRQGDRGKQLLLLEAEIEATPDQGVRAGLCLERSRLQLERRDTDGRAEAHQGILRALSFAPGDLRALKALERLQILAGDHDSLLETLRQQSMATDDPVEQAGLALRMARLRERIYDDLDGAADLVAVAAGMFPSDPLVLAEQIRLQDARRSIMEVTEALERMVEGLSTPGESKMILDPAAGPMLWRLAQLYRDRLSREDLAWMRLEQLVAMSPNDQVALAELRHLYARAGLRSELASTLERELALSSDPRDVIDTCTHLGEVYLSLNDHPTAIKHLKRVLGIDPTHHPSLRMLGRILAAGGRWQELADMHRKEAQAAPTAVSRGIAMFRWGEALERVDADQAIEIYRGSMDALPGLAASLRALERLFAARGRLEELAKLYEREVERSRTEERKVALLYELVDVWQNYVGDADGAIDAASRILQIQPDDNHAATVLGRLYAETERWRELAFIRERAARRTQDRHRAVALLFEVGRLREERLADSEAAIDTYVKVLELDPTYLPALASLGGLFRRTGRWADLLEMHRAEIRRGASVERTAALRYEIGEIYEVNLRDPAAAENEYREVLGLVADHRPAIRALLRLAEGRGDDEAIAATRDAEARAISDTSERARLWIQAGHIYEDRIGNLDEAESCYRRALRAVPGHVAATLALLDLLGRREEWHKVAEACRRALRAEEEPTRRLAYMERLADVYDQRVPNPERAASVYEQILEVAPAHPLALRALCRIYEWLERWQPLAEVLQRRAEASRDPGVRFAVIMDLGGLLEHRLGDDEAAARAYREAAQIQPDHPAPTVALATLGVIEEPDEVIGSPLPSELPEDPSSDYRLQTRALALQRKAEQAEASGNLPEASRLLAEAVALMPDTLPLVSALKRVRFRLGDAAAYADACWREGELLADPRRAALDFMAAGKILRERLQRNADAVECFRRAFELVPGSKKAFELLRSALAALQRWDDLLDHYATRVSIETDPDQLLTIHNEIATIWGDRKGDDEAAAASLMRALERRPDDFGTLRSLAERERRLGRFERAVATLARAASVAPGMAERIDTLQVRAEVAEKHLDDVQLAQSAWKDVVDLAPNSITALERYAQISQDKGDLLTAARARQQLAEALRHAPTEARRQNAVELMRLYSEWLGDQSETIRAARHVLTLDPTHAEAIDLVAETLMKMGERAQLVEHLQSSERALREAIAADPLQAKPYRTLAQVAQRLGRRDELYQATVALMCLEPAPDDLARFVEENRTRAATPPRHPMDVQDIRERLIHPQARGAARDLLIIGLEALAKVAGHKPDRWGLGRGDRVTKVAFAARTDLEIAGVALKARELELYRNPGPQSKDAPVIALPTDSLALLIHPKASEQESCPARRFSFGSALVASLWGHSIARELGAESIERHLHALVGSARPGILPQGSVVFELARKLGKALPRRARRGVEDLSGPYLQQREQLKAPALLEALSLTEDRYGLLCCGDVASAVAALLAPWRAATKDGSPTDPELAREALTGLGTDSPHRRRLGALLAFSVSEEHLQLRQRIGITLDR